MDKQWQCKENGLLRVGRRMRLLVLAVLSMTLVACGSATVVVRGEYPTPLIERYPYSAGIVLSPEFTNYIYKEAREERGVSSVDIGSAQTAIIENVLGAMFTRLEKFETKPLIADVDILFEPRLEDFQYSLPAETSVDVLEVWARYGIRIYDEAGREITDWDVTAYGKTDQRFMSGTGTIFENAVMVAVRDLGANMILELPRDTGFSSWLDNKRKQVR